MSTITTDTVLPKRQSHHSRSTAERLDGYAEILMNHRRRLARVSAIYLEQPSVYPLQVEATLTHLMRLRQVAGAARAYLDRLVPAETQRVKPIGCIGKLASLDYLLTEILLHVAMFAVVCQAICPERVQVHLTIRAKFSVLLIAYDDLLAQLSALAERARQEVTVTQEQGGQA